MGFISKYVYRCSVAHRSRGARDRGPQQPREAQEGVRGGGEGVGGSAGGGPGGGGPGGHELPDGEEEPTGRAAARGWSPEAEPGPWPAGAGRSRDRGSGPGGLREQGFKGALGTQRAAGRGQEALRGAAGAVGSRPLEAPRHRHAPRGFWCRPGAEWKLIFWVAPCPAQGFSQWPASGAEVKGSVGTQGLAAHRHISDFSHSVDPLMPVRAEILELRPLPHSLLLGVLCRPPFFSPASAFWLDRKHLCSPALKGFPRCTPPVTRKAAGLYGKSSTHSLHLPSFLPLRPRAGFRY